MMNKLALSLAISLFFVGAAQANNCNPDGFGGMRCSDGSRYSPDGFGGMRGNDGTRISHDGFGGQRVTSPNGQMSHCSPDGFGGTRCN